MLVVPDPTTAFLDPFTPATTLVLICDIRDPVTGVIRPAILTQYGVGPWSRTGKPEWIDRGTGLLEKSPCRDIDPIALSSSARSPRSF